MNWFATSALALALPLAFLSGCDTESGENDTDDASGDTSTGAGVDGGDPSGDGDGGGEASDDGGDEGNDADDDGGGETSVELDLNPPCIDDSVGITVLDAVAAKAGGSPYAQAVVDGSNDIADVIATIGALPFPDDTAVVAEVDDLTVFEGDTAYTWDQYLYVGRGDGYQIYVMDDGLLPDEIIYVDQNADCTSFSLSNYDGDGNTLLFLGANLIAPTAGFDWHRGGPEDFSMREFEDGSGDFQRNVDDTADLRVGWNAQGEGTYTLFEDGNPIEDGLW
ncbi:MAG: hypothetical protein AAGA54_22915 [Myxococcota bacterium]